MHSSSRTLLACTKQCKVQILSTRGGGDGAEERRKKMTDDREVSHGKQCGNMKGVGWELSQAVRASFWSPSGVSRELVVLLRIVA